MKWNNYLANVFIDISTYMVKIAEKHYIRAVKSNKSITLIRFHRNHIKALQIRFLLEKLWNLPDLLKCAGTLLSNTVECLHLLMCVFTPLFNNKVKPIFILEIMFSSILNVLKIVDSSSHATYENAKPQKNLHLQLVSEK